RTDPAVGARAAGDHDRHAARPRAAHGAAGGRMSAPTGGPGIGSAPRSSAQLWWGVGAVVFMATIAAVAEWPIYENWRVALVVGVGVLIGAGSVLLGWFLRLRWGWTAGIATLGYLVAVVPVA